MDNAGDDSDGDVVTDFLNSNCTDPNTTPSSAVNGVQRVTVESQNYCIPVINAPAPPVESAPVPVPPSVIPPPPQHNNINNNMIPTINVTPHSPALASKYNNIFEDTLSQLQSIRETVVQMKNSSTSSHPMKDGLGNHNILSTALLSSSLPDLTGAGTGSGAHGAHSTQYAMWTSNAPQQCLFLNTDRRKSWTAVDDGGGDCTNKSVSLSSLDSEEQETIRVTEQRRRSARNSTGGIYLFCFISKNIGIFLFFGTAFFVL